jgi:hypothetical protein
MNTIGRKILDDNGVIVQSGNQSVSALYKVYLKLEKEL